MAKVELLENNRLTLQEATTLTTYRRFYFKDKQDIKGPRLSGSSVMFYREKQLSDKFVESSPHDTSKELQAFRAQRRALKMHNPHLIDFVEALFNYPKNDLDFYQTWSKPLQQRSIEVLKLLTSLLRFDPFLV